MAWNNVKKEFGPVNVGDILKHTFVYEGDKKITKAVASCGCTTTKITPKTVDAEMAMKNTKVMKKHITVTFDDKSKSTLTLIAHNKANHKKNV